jgi:hypothetical protein
MNSKDLKKLRRIIRRATPTLPLRNLLTPRVSMFHPLPAYNDPDTQRARYRAVKAIFAGSKGPNSGRP